MSDYFDRADGGADAPTPLFAGAAAGLEPAGAAACREPAGAAACLGPADAAVALRELHEEYAHKLFNYTYSVLRCREDAEDAVQTTFMNAYGSLQDGQVPRQSASWLFRIARNVCLNRIRSQQRKPSSTLEGIDVPSLRSVDDQLDQHLHMAAMRSAIGRLPEQQRKAIVMRELQGASYTEIATALDTTHGAVESLIFRARRQLVSAMQRSGSLRPDPTAPVRRAGGGHGLPQAA